MGNFLSILHQKNEPLFWFSVLNFALCLACLAMMQLDNTEVLGINAWVKPFKFYISTLFFTGSMAWYMQYLGENYATTVRGYSWGLIVLLCIENVYITAMAAKGLRSHFNVETPFFASMWTVMAVASTLISATTVFIAIAFFKSDFPTLPPAYLWAIRIGLILFIVFSLQGLAMGGRLSHTVGGADGSAGLPLVNWSRTYGDLRIAHFLGMHALQIIPILAYYLVRNVKMVFIISTLYALFTLFVFVQALRGKPFLS